MKENNLSGWYYDLQRDNEITSVKLLANTYKSNEKRKKNVFTTDSDGNKIFATEGGSNNTLLFEEEGTGENIWKKAVDAKGENPGWWEEDSDGYNKLLCKSIISEDFNITTTNSWTDFGGDPLGAAWEGIAKPLAPYSVMFKDALNSLVEKQNIRKSSGVEEGKVASLISKATELMSTFSNNSSLSEYLNKSLVVQGTRFTYYSGTGISFNNLGMRFTIFPRYDENGKFMSVLDQIGDILPYIVGRFVPFHISDTQTASLVQKFVGNTAIKDVESFVTQYVNWQEPPGGFMAKNKDVDQTGITDADSPQFGTLKLKIGGLYAITNLVCADASLTFSKQMVKGPSSETPLTPLYCDVNLMLKPATKYSDKSLMRFINGTAMENDQNNIKKRLKDGLVATKKN